MGTPYSDRFTARPVTLAVLVLKYPVVLASASPRRRALLSQIVPEFEVVVSGVDEDQVAYAHKSESDPHHLAGLLAKHKADSVATFKPGCLVIGADTIVALDGHELGKPQDDADARRMLSLLSGRQHEVITGVSLIAPGVQDTFYDRTLVRFRDLSDREIVEYVASGEPMDKAGAYAIQGGAKHFASKVEGSVSNVIGLPIEALGDRLMLRGLVRSVC